MVVDTKRLDGLINPHVLEIITAALPASLAEFIKQLKLMAQKDLQSRLAESALCLPWALHRLIAERVKCWWWYFSWVAFPQPNKFNLSTSVQQEFTQKLYYFCSTSPSFSLEAAMLLVEALIKPSDAFSCSDLLLLSISLLNRGNKALLGRRGQRVLVSGVKTNWWPGTSGVP